MSTTTSKIERTVSFGFSRWFMDLPLGVIEKVGGRVGGH